MLWGTVAGSMAVWSACDIYDTYRTEGPGAALIQAGTEVVVTAAGVKAFKIAGRVFYTAEAAWGAYLVENPRMAAIAEYCVEQSGKAKGFALEQGAKLADYVKSTGAGKFVSSINAKVEAKFAQWFGNAEAGTASSSGETATRTNLEGVEKPKVDKWIRTPSSLQDEMAMKAAKAGEGRPIRNITLNDPRYSGMIKMRYAVKSANGKDTVIHYIYDPKTGERMDFKFKKRSLD